jgi:subtilisin family serine protease
MECSACNILRFGKPGFLLLLSLLIVACGGSSGGGSDDPEVTAYTELNSDVFTGDTYEDSEVSIDYNGDEIVRTKLAILFTPDATKFEVDALLDRINATITASIAGARSVSIRIPDPGNVDALDALIADIESEAFVEAAMKSVVFKTPALPDNINENTSDYDFITHHAAVHGTAAWNAREAITHIPNIMIMDKFGGGRSQLSSYLDADISGTVHNLSGSGSFDHGYHVAGIINGSFGGGFSTADLVTGMMPDKTKFHVIDITNGMSDHDAEVLAISTAKNISGTMVFNTSLRISCQATTSSGTCREKNTAMKEGVKWADMVRAANLEDRMFHTTAAGNRGNPAPAMRDTQTSIPFTTAATMTDMTTFLGFSVPILTNTMVVENLIGTGSPPAKTVCLSNNSFVGGNISAIGTDVMSLFRSGAGKLSGTSMSAPQVAGLAAYMLAIDNALTPQRIKSILQSTADSVPTSVSGCSNWPTPAKAINAYAAVLALDDKSALDGNRTDAPVRNAILDIVAGDPNVLGSNDKFDENDLAYFIEQFNVGSEEKRNGTDNVKYSRADLNGDGYDGGSDGYKKKFNLDINYPPTYTTVKQTIEGEEVEFNEASLTDSDILCYYAYSDLYTGSENQRKTLMENRCKSARMAVYYSHHNEITFPGLDASCDPLDEDQEAERESLTTRPDMTGSDIPDRPESHFWYAGKSSIDQTTIDKATNRSEKDSSSECLTPQNYYAKSALDSELTLSDTGNRLYININAQSESDCLDMNPETELWECSTATTLSSWVSEFDFKISAATNATLKINLNCSGGNLSLPGEFQTAPKDLTFSVLRLDHTGNFVPQHNDPAKWTIAQFYECNDDFSNINIEELIEFDTPLEAGTSDRVVIVVTGQGGAFGHLGNAAYLADNSLPIPSDGRESNTTTMTGYVELVPAE